MQNKKRVLVTGINGLLGSIILNTLSEHFIVRGVDRSGHHDDKTFFRADISNLNQLQSVFERLEVVDYVIHLAANASSESSWETVFKDNFETTRNVYECASKFGVKKVIFASSTHAFGGYPGYPNVSPLGRKISAKDPFISDSDYGDSKAYGELISRRYYDQHGIETISLRIGHVTKNDVPESKFAPLWISHRDLSQIILKAIQAKVGFGAYFAMSDNKKNMFEIESTTKDLEYLPQDSID